jgi:hypothetical protein
MKKRTPALLLLLLLSGCTRQARSLIAVEVDGAAIQGLASITLTARPVRASGERTASFTWTTTGTKMTVGIYVDFEADEGSVKADGYASGGASPIAASNPQTVRLAPGKTTTTVRLTLMAVAGGTDAGTDGRTDASATDGGVDAGAPDGVVDAPAGPDQGPDGVPPERSWVTENLEKETLSPSSAPAVAIHPTAGHALVAWHDGKVVKISRYDADTRQWATTTIDHGDAPLFPQVAVAGNGHAVVVWRNDNDLTSGDLKGVWAVHSVDGGKTWAKPVAVYTGPVHRSDLTLAMAASGDARVAFSAYIDNEALTAVWSAGYLATSGAWSGAMLRATSCACRAHPRIAMDEAGAGLVVWNDSGDASLWGAAFAPTTTALAALGLMPSSRMAGDPSPAIYPGGGGRGIVVWGEGGSLWLKEYNPTMGGWLAAARALADASAHDPVASVDAAGNIAVAWGNRPSSGVWNVAAAIRPAGGTWNATGLETMNMAFGGDSPAPRIGHDASGNVHVVWRRRTVPSGDTWGVYSRRWTAASGTWQPEVELSLKSGLMVSSPELAVARDGRAAAAFYYGDPNSTRDPDAYNVFASLYK